jgi:hypothetical protein
LPDPDDAPVTRREIQMRWQAHTELHHAHELGHDREHAMTAEALTTAVGAMDKRLEGMNEFRSSLRDQAGTFVRLDTYQALLDRVIALEKADVRGEARGQGYSTLIGWIVAAVGLTATVLGIVVVIANLLTAKP